MKNKEEKEMLSDKYKKDKVEIKTKIIGYAHTHSAGYYDEQCGGCIMENKILNSKNQNEGEE